MTDRELLELAAKAAGEKLPIWSEKINDHDSCHYGHPALHGSSLGGQCQSWNPLIDDGDALRLAVKLGLYIDNEQELSGCVTVSWGCDAGGAHLGSVVEEAPDGGDDCAATRRAIVRAAAEIGRGMS